MGWRFNLAFWETPLALTGWPKIINEKGHVVFTEWSLTCIEAPFCLPCCSPYINQILFLSFLYFLLKSTIRVHPSSLSDDHTVQLLHASSTPLYRPTSTCYAFFSLYFKFYALFYFIFLDFCTTVIHYRPIRVLGFTITCKSCLVRRVTSRLPMTEQATMKCTRQVIKTLTV